MVISLGRAIAVSMYIKELSLAKLLMNMLILQDGLSETNPSLS